MIEFHVPGAPVGKGRPRIGRVGAHARMFTPAKTVSYELTVALAAQQAMFGRPLFDGAVSVAMAINCPIPASWSKRKQKDALHGRILPTTKPDIDNVEKSIFDALTGVVWRDDVQVVRVMKSKRYAETPGVRVWIDVAA
jgi:Holliday junction resolvase RusA-like endonuclease